MLDFSVLLWYCVVLTGGATNGKHNQRTVARQYHTARGQQNQLKGDERAPWVYGTSSRRPRKDLYLGTERNLREVPRLLERIHEPSGKGNIRICVQARSKIDDRKLEIAWRCI